MIIAQVNYTRLAAVIDTQEVQSPQYVADASFTRLAAIVELQDAQGWKSISETPQYRAEIDFVKVKATDVYTLIVDKIDLSDEIITSDSQIFRMDKVLSDDAVITDPIAFYVSKPFSDDAAAIESIALHMSKPFSDDVNQTDSAVFNMNKAISDDVNQTDSALFLMLIGGTGSINGAGLDATPIAQQKSKVFSA